MTFSTSQCMYVCLVSDIDAIHSQKLKGERMKWASSIKPIER